MGTCQTDPRFSIADIAEWAANVASGKWIWARNSRCKYVTLYIDTRSGAYRIEDRDGNAISGDELRYQYRGEHTTREQD